MERCLWALHAALSRRHEILIVCRDAESESQAVRVLGPLASNWVNMDRDQLLDGYIEKVTRFERNCDLVLSYNFPEVLPALSRPCLCLFFDHKKTWLPRGPGNSPHTFLFPGRWLRDSFAEETGQPSERCQWLPMGVDTKLFHPGRSLPATEGPIRLIFSAVWHQGKGIELFLQACEQLDQRGLPFRSILAGSTGLWDFGDQQENIYPLLERLKVEGTVSQYGDRLPQLEVAGEVAHAKLPELFRRSDLVIAPSIWRECLPLTVIEGMASGTPALASAHGGAAEIIEDGISGHLLKRADPITIAAKVGDIIASGGVTKEMRDAARQAVLPLSWNVVAGKLEKFFP